MHVKECKRVKCDLLAKEVFGKDYHCLDTNSPIENVCQCGIANGSLVNDKA